MVSRDDEEAIRPEIKPLQKTGEEACCGFVLCGLAPVGHVAGEANQVHSPVLN